MRIGVLGVQGDVPEHLAAVRRVVGPQNAVRVDGPASLGAVDALVLPGGESTAIATLLDRADLWRPLEERLRAGLPVLATCAGLILLAREVEPSVSGTDPRRLEVLDVNLRRNGYGAQRESFEAPLAIDGLGGAAFPGVFIRAPRILETGAGVLPFARLGDEVVGVRSATVWGLTFHPELSGDDRILRAFAAQSVRAAQKTPKANAKATAKRTKTPAKT